MPWFIFCWSYALLHLSHGRFYGNCSMLGWSLGFSPLCCDWVSQSGRWCSSAPLWANWMIYKWQAHDILMILVIFYDSSWYFMIFWWYWWYFDDILMTFGDLVSPMRGARAASSPAGLARLLDFVSWQDCLKTGVLLWLTWVTFKELLMSLKGEITSILTNDNKNLGGSRGVLIAPCVAVLRLLRCFSSLSGRKQRFWTEINF